MGNYRKLWFTLIGVLIVTFSLLGYYGAEVYRTAPPIPAKIVTAGGEVLYTNESILDGQTAWQSVGGMQLGSIWGHGAYQAPDWTADWLHRELLNWLEVAAERAHGKPFAELFQDFFTKMNGRALTTEEVLAVKKLRKRKDAEE